MDGRDIDLFDNTTAFIDLELFVSAAAAAIGVGGGGGFIGHSGGDIDGTISSSGSGGVGRISVIGESSLLLQHINSTIIGSTANGTGDGGIGNTTNDHRLLHASSSSSSLSVDDRLNRKGNNNNYWALSALILVFGTAAGNILVCLAVAWERRLQNVTNYFLMSLAITDLMVAILVMPLGILTLVKGKFFSMLFFFAFFHMHLMRILCRIYFYLNYREVFL